MVTGESWVVDHAPAVSVAEMRHKADDATPGIQVGPDRFVTDHADLGHDVGQRSMGSRKASHQYRR